MIQNEQKRGLLIPKTDVVFQALFGTKGNEEILGCLLSKIIKENVENISLDANQNLISKVPDEKIGVLDLRAKIGDKVDVEIEVQLLILDFELKELDSFKNAHAEHKIVDMRDPKVIIFKNLEIHIIELPKIMKYPEETEKELKRWMEFLINPESEVVKMGAKEDKKLGEAMEKLEYISGDEELRRIAELREKYILDEESERDAVREEAREEGLAEGRAEGLKQGIEEGRKEGRKEGIKETAKRLLKLKIPIEQIVNVTELSEEELKQITKEL